MRTTDTPAETTEYLQAVSALGARVSDACDLAALAQEGAALIVAQAAGEAAPVAHIAACFGLDAAEQLLLARCVYCLLAGQELPRLGEARTLLRKAKSEARELSPIFVPDASGGCLHPFVQRFLLRRALPVTEGLQLDFCADDAPLFHSESLLAEMTQFAQNAAEQECFPSAIVLKGTPGSGKQFLLRRLAAAQGCTLLTVLKEQNPQDVIVLALLYDSLIYIKNYREAYRPMTDRLFAAFGLLLFSAEETLPEHTVALLCRSDRRRAAGGGLHPRNCESDAGNPFKRAFRIGTRRRVDERSSCFAAKTRHPVGIWIFGGDAAAGLAV